MDGWMGGWCAVSPLTLLPLPLLLSSGTAAPLCSFLSTGPAPSAPIGPVKVEQRESAATLCEMEFCRVLPGLFQSNDFNFPPRT